MMKMIKDYEVLDHGVEHAQFFQGCGVSFTRFNSCVTGVGETAQEAYDDCLEQMAQMDIEVDACLPMEPGFTGQVDREEDNEHDERYYHVSVRWV